MEYPQYTGMIDKKALIMTSILKILLLGLLFYAGLIFNLNLLSISASTASTVKLYSIIIILFLLVIELLLDVKRSRLSLFQRKIVAGNTEISYGSITNMKIKKIFLDKFFGTATLLLNEKKIRYLKNPEYVVAYINRMKEYYRYYSQYR